MCEEKILLCGTSVQEYMQRQEVVLDELCNGFVVKNAGTTLVIFQGDILQPGESKSFGGNRLEIYRTRADIVFQVQTVPPLVVTNLCFVTQKFYMNRDLLNICK